MSGRAGGGDFDDSGDVVGEESELGFQRAQGGVTATFTAAQAGIVRNLVSQVAELIAQDEPGGAGGGWPGAAPGQPGGAGPDEGDQAGSQSPFGIEDIAAILGGGPTSPPQDPVLARLFPDAYRDDAASAGEFRRFTEHGLRSAKVEAARTVLATLPGEGGRVQLSPEQAQPWLRALNDVRLALGVRLGITEDYEEQIGQLRRDDPRSAFFWVYDWLSGLQDTLVRALW